MFIASSAVKRLFDPNSFQNTRVRELAQILQGNCYTPYLVEKWSPPTDLQWNFITVGTHQSNPSLLGLPRKYWQQAGKSATVYSMARRTSAEICSNSSPIRTGKLLQHLLAVHGIEASAEEIKLLTNGVNGQLNLSSVLRIYSGADIADKIYGGGHIGIQSCMVNTQPFRLELYTSNKDHVAAVCLLDLNRNVILARAILWREGYIEYDGETTGPVPIVDRIYYRSESDCARLCYLLEQQMPGVKFITTLRSTLDRSKLKLSAKVRYWMHTVPYLDTFSCIDLSSLSDTGGIFVDFVRPYEHGKNSVAAATALSSALATGMSSCIKQTYEGADARTCLKCGESSFPHFVAHHKMCWACLNLRQCKYCKKMYGQHAAFHTNLSMCSTCAAERRLSCARCCSTHGLTPVKFVRRERILCASHARASARRCAVCKQHHSVSQFGLPQNLMVDSYERDGARYPIIIQTQICRHCLVSDNLELITTRVENGVRDIQTYRTKER